MQGLSEQVLASMEISHPSETVGFYSRPQSSRLLTHLGASQPMSALLCLLINLACPLWASLCRTAACPDVSFQL